MGASTRPIYYKIFQGDTGVEGATGVNGATGLSGEQGSTGFGIQGIQGSTGLQGTQGLTGASGSGGGISITSKMYVDGSNGNDTTATGNPDKPYKTIQACLNAIGQPITMQDALRHFEIYLSDALTASIGNNAGANQSWNGVYKENLTVPCRMITIFGKGVKIGNNVYNVDSGYGNILKEYSASRRFGVASADLRPCLTFVGLTECRDSHSRLRSGIHVGGTCRTSILKRTFDSIQGDGSNKITVHIASGQFYYPITIPTTYPTEPLIRIAVQGTTNYNATYDIVQKIDDVTFVAQRISGTNVNTGIETSGSFFESDSAGASGVTHDSSFINCFMQGQYTCDDGTVNSAAPTAGGEVLFSAGSRWAAGIEGRGITVQRWDNTTLAGTSIVSTIAGMNNCSFAGALTTSTFTYSTDDMGWANCRFNSAMVFTVSSASQTVRMDDTTYNSFLNAGCTWATNTPTVQKSYSSLPVALTAQTATKALTTLITPPVDGMYLLNLYCSCTTAGTAGTVTPALQWNDDTTLQTLNLSPVSLAAQGAYSQQAIAVKCKAGVAIKYSATVSGATGSPQYALYVSVKNLF